MVALNRQSWATYYPYFNLNFNNDGILLAMCIHFKDGMYFNNTSVNKHYSHEKHLISYRSSSGNSLACWISCLRSSRINSYFTCHSSYFYTSSCYRRKKNLICEVEVCLLTVILKRMTVFSVYDIKSV